jgi:hypothetical protein
MSSFSEKKLSEVPPEIARLALKVALDTSLTQAAIHVFAYFALNATGTGYIVASTAPLDVSAALGINRATVFRAYAILEVAGYIVWDRAVGIERARGVTGRLQIRVPQASR